MDQLTMARAHYQAIKLRVTEAHPDLDEQTLADTVEGLTNLHDIVAAIIRSAVTDEALGTGPAGRELQRCNTGSCDLKNAPPPDVTSPATS